MQADLKAWLEMQTLHASDQVLSLVPSRGKIAKLDGAPAVQSNADAADAADAADSADAAAAATARTTRNAHQTKRR